MKFGMSIMPRKTNPPLRFIFLLPIISVFTLVLRRSSLQENELVDLPQIRPWLLSFAFIYGLLIILSFDALESG